MDFEPTNTRCANCPTPAIAEVDDTPLCEGCLLSLIMSSRDSLIVDRVRAIRPLCSRRQLQPVA